MPCTPVFFDRANGRFGRMSVAERCAAAVLQAGARASARFQHRGYSLGCRVVTSVIRPRDVVVRLNADAQFAFPLGDGYWSLLLDPAYEYEWELHPFLRSLADVDYTFIDGGANFGFWSVLLSSAPYGGHPVVAVEAAAANAEKLRRNARLNGDRFDVLHNAIGATSGQRGWIAGHKHEAMHLGAAQNGGEEVTTVTVDDLRRRLPEDRRFLIKLDVEGAEIAALEGARATMDTDALFICEDHASDREHTVSRHILNHTGCRLFIHDPAIGCFTQLIDLAALDRIKTDRSKGYNVLATRSPFWEERIRALKPWHAPLPAAA